jgi:hypothetical protein
MFRKSSKSLIVKPMYKEEIIPSEGEINYLWWFIQGSIMSPDVRARLRRAWGFCERHAWAAILVEASLRDGYMHGPSILYSDMMQRAMAVLDASGPGKNLRIETGLREKGPCIMCEMNLGPEAVGIINKTILVKGQDAAPLRRIYERSRNYWEHAVCGRCLGNNVGPRCRRHFVEEAPSGFIENLPAQRALVSDILNRINKYSRSYRWEYQGTRTVEDEASLICAVGWCSGWRPLLSVVGMKK